MSWDSKSPKISKRRRSSTSKDVPTKAAKSASLKALIIDNGGYTIKAGYNRDEEPQIIPNCIMKAKSERKRLFIGKQIDECRDCSGLFFLLPCEKGYITRWEVQKPVWDQLFGKDVCPINDNPTIITQPLFNFKSIQDCMDEIFFEEYEVPSLFRCNPTDLAYLNYAKENRLSRNEACLIIDSGYSFTHIIPYIKGNKFIQAAKRLNVGGKLLTNHLKDIISYRQYNVMEETYVINQVKEDTCYVCEDVKAELREAAKPFSKNTIVKNYVLPDFNNIRRGYIQQANKTDEKEESCQILRLNNERFVVPEILFHPSDIGMKSMGIAEAAVKSIYSCPKIDRKALARNIIIVGGNCKFPGFKERLYAELRSLLPDLWDVKVFLPSDPITYAWKGGGALLKLHDFKSNLVTRQDYEELGSAIIQERFNNFMIDDSRLDDSSKPPKEQTNFKYLEKLKSRSIFGKQELCPSGSSNDPTNEENGAASNSKNEQGEDGIVDSNKEESNSVSDEASQDSFQAVEVDKGKKSKVTQEKQSEDDVDIDSDVSEEDLTKSLELFPFGTGSYL
ncbi:actin-related protein 6 [Sitophilus oryzae]|uniref:Actin-related protein 6 n=1 Tax=Sitophilus oryzae TaxID=7048 RepID=A0A6J2YQM3_SITOR|nr:actin-related protein 6 [Sitophilus oryzae]